MSSHTKDSVPIAEKLFELVKSISEPNADAFTVWKTKNEIHKTCDILLAKTLGPLEHAALVAGTWSEIYLFD
jgi:hypothetical protein